MKALFKTFPALLKEFGETVEVREALVFAAWRQIAGELLAGHTVPVSSEAQRLVIAVSDRTWKRHLEDLSGQMLFKLNSALGSQTVTFLEFRIDAAAIDKLRRPQKKRAVRSKADRLEPQLIESANVISDAELRNNFLLAAESCLERQERIEAADRK
jgi:predicted nucleic acid-binding Zn ribbon protein